MKRNNNILLFLLLAVWVVFFNSDLWAKDSLVHHKQINNYQISILKDRERDLEKVLIKKGETILFHEEGVGEHFYFGNNFDDDLNSKHIYSGHSLTNKGIPNLLISQWTGGAHCCHFLYIFELGQNFKLIGKIDAGSSNIKITDLDHDNSPEIIFWDGAIDYQFASFAHSPKGKIILKFQNGSYSLATRLMEKPLPSQKEFEALKRKSLTQFIAHETDSELPYTFLEVMMNLSYSGHFDEALKFADAIWPKTKDGLDKFKADFSLSLKESKFWKDF